MFIQTEATPNPNTLKFLPGQAVLGEKTAFFTDRDNAKASPLASALFVLADIRAVFFGSDFITVTKTEAAQWDALKPQILTTVMEHYQSGLPLMQPVKASAGTTENTKDYSADEQEVVDQIKELLETRVRPAVAQDGGDIIFHSFKEGIVRLEMHGACSGCPSSTATLKSGIENMLKHYIPEVLAVEPA
ncbi:MAG: NifU family protein [Alphaproteobacteria bacterium]|nr:NifU family protein [Alphaproteobacteria bacterium]